jgi:hypothetical protein
MGYNSFSTLTNFNVNKNLSISTGYSVIGNSYINLPLVFLFKRDFGQIYIGTDNLTSILLPSLDGYAEISFGACFYLWRNKDLSDKASDENPFFRPRKIKKDKESGLILRNHFGT